MATFKKPVVYDEKTGTHDEAREGQILTPAVVPVDSSGGNVLGKSDAGLYLRPEDLVSKEGGNLLSIGADGKLHASYEAPDAPSPVSTDAGNILPKAKTMLPILPPGMCFRLMRPTSCARRLPMARSS